MFQGWQSIQVLCPQWHLSVSGWGFHGQCSQWSLWWRAG